jgi:hypothetical protein
MAIHPLHLPSYALDDSAYCRTVQSTGMISVAKMNPGMTGRAWIIHSVSMRPPMIERS